VFLRPAIRSLRKSPGFIAVAVLTLALGIGANTAIFSVIHSVLLRPLAFPEAERLVRIWDADVRRNFERITVSYPRFVAFRDQQPGVFTDVAASTFTNGTLTGRGDPQQLQIVAVSQRFFATLRVQPVLGRDFSAEEDRPGGAAVALLSYGLWQRVFGGDHSILGQSILLDGQPVTVIGVMPPLPGAPYNQVDVWVPRVFAVPFLTPQQVERGAGYLILTARLAPGVTIAAADRAVALISDRYGQTYPEHLDARFHTATISFLDELVGQQRPAFYTLFAAVGFVLLIACANVANLLLTRFASRSKEVGVRLALGATRGRIVGQFVAEALLLSLVAGALGAVFAAWGVDALARLGRDFIPRAAEISLEWPVLAFALGLSALTGLAMGLFPALQASRADVVTALKDSARGSTGVRHQALRHALVVTEVAISLVLLVCASLLIASFAQLRRVDAGFRAEGVWTGAINLSPAKYPTNVARGAFFERLLGRLAEVPGVRAVAVAENTPLSDNTSFSPIAVSGRANPPLDQRPFALRLTVSPGHFSTLGVPLRQGRDFNPRDRLGMPDVVIINETLARQFFPDGHAVGQKLIMGMAQRLVEIVGVVGDVRYEGLATPARPAMFLPVLQQPALFTTIIARTDGQPAALTASLRSAVREVDPDLPIVDPKPLATVVAQSVGDRRLVMMLLGGFAAIALLLAALGIYSVLAYAVAQRTNEIGIRMALGASAIQVQRMVIREGMMLAGIGLALGLAGSLGLARLLSTQLFGITAGNPFAYSGMVLLLGSVALLACWLPSRRATNVDPVIALRAE
jgi:predicted permease